MTNRLPRVYIAGPMTWYPYFNFPAFDAAAKKLRNEGYDVISPAELDSSTARAAAMKSPDGDPAHYEDGESWGNCLARDVRIIADDGVEAIFVLDGWEKSRGARLETFVARLCGLPCYYFNTREQVPPAALERAHGTHEWTLASGSKSNRDPKISPIHKSLKPCPVSKLEYSETRITNFQTGGEKGSKPEAYHLLPWEQLDEVARLYEFGTNKYSAHNWRRGYSWSLSFSSLIRHARSWWAGEMVDSETGCDHMAAVIFHALALMFFNQNKSNLPDDLDDRWVGNV